MTTPRFRAIALSLTLLLVSGAALAAQEASGLPQGGRLAAQNLRPYWHVFAAYTLVIVLVGGWAVSIGRRLSALEERLND